MSNITPFPPPRLLSANLKKDLVDISTNASNNDGVSSTVAYSGDRGWDNSVLEGDSCASEEGMPQSSVEGNEEAMSRTIIEIETQSSSSSTTGSISGDDTAAKPAIVAFWLQRKLDHQSRSRDLVVRLGYRLRRKNTIKNDTKRLKTGEDHVDDRGWELDRDTEGRLILVRVHISHNDVFAVNQSQSQSMWLKSQLNELSALQMIATQNYSSSSQMALQAAHVVGTSLIAKDEENGKIYTILPYHRDGTLLQFCQSMGNLEESLARFIFRQIVQVRNKIMIGESSAMGRILILTREPYYKSFRRCVGIEDTEKLWIVSSKFITRYNRSRWGSCGHHWPGLGLAMRRSDARDFTRQQR